MTTAQVALLNPPSLPRVPGYSQVVTVIGGDLVEVAPPVGSVEESRRTVAVGAKYVLDTIDALTGTTSFRVT